MSVLKEFRRTSKTEYVDNAIRIFEDSLSMVTRLSARYERVLGQFVMEIANQMVQHVEEGNSIRITDQVTYDLRESHLVEAKALVRALDVDLRIVCDILGENPQGAYKTSNNQPVSSDKAKKRLGYLIDNTGSNIDREIALIDGVLASDKKAWSKKMGIKDEEESSEAKEAKIVDELKKEDSSEVLLEEPEGAQKAREQLFEISQNSESNQTSEVEDVSQNTSGENGSDESEPSELSCESGSDNSSDVKIESDDSDDERKAMIQANEVLETAKAACNSMKSKSDSKSTIETMRAYDPKKVKKHESNKDSIDDLPDYHIEPKKK